MIDQLELKQSTIQPWRLDDAESLTRHANNRKVWLSLRDRFPHPYTTEDARKFLEATVEFEPITDFCIEVNGAAVGGIGIHLGIVVHRQSAELGYWLGEEFWGRGIISRRLERLLIFVSIDFRCGEFTPNRLRTIALLHACWRNQVSC